MSLKLSFSGPIIVPVAFWKTEVSPGMTWPQWPPALWLEQILYSQEMNNSSVSEWRDQSDAGAAKGQWTRTSHPNVRQWVLLRGAGSGTGFLESVIALLIEHTVDWFHLQGKGVVPTLRFLAMELLDKDLRMVIVDSKLLHDGQVPVEQIKVSQW